MGDPDNIIKVSSVNTRGLQTANKRIDVLDYLKNTDYNIISLQDCHWHNDNYCELILSGITRSILMAYPLIQGE